VRLAAAAYRRPGGISKTALEEPLTSFTSPDGGAGVRYRERTELRVDERPRTTAAGATGLSGRAGSRTRGGSGMRGSTVLKVNADEGDKLLVVCIGTGAGLFTALRKAPVCQTLSN